VPKLYEGELPEPAGDEDEEYDSGHDNADDTHDGGDRHFCAGGLKCEGKAVWKGKNKTVKSKVRKRTMCCFKAWQIQDEIHGAV
jgi:hypothetical protein